MDIDWTRHVVIGLISALAVFAMITWGSKSPADRQGWRSIRPGRMYVAAICLGGLLTLFLACIWLFVGSDRPDGESQMRILFWLTISFGGATLITLLQYGQARRSAMRWRGDHLYWRGKGGSDYDRKLSHAQGLRKSFMGPVYVIFDDGTEARVDPYASNALALIQQVADRLGPQEDSRKDGDG